MTVAIVTGGSSGIGRATVAVLRERGHDVLAASRSGADGTFASDLTTEDGCRAASYTEAQGVAAMAPEDIVIRVELGRGDAAAVVWTTDFSYDYVRINAEYRS